MMVKPAFMSFFATCHTGEHIAYLGTSQHAFPFKSSKGVVNTLSLQCSQAVHFSFCRSRIGMGIIIQCHLDIRMSHDILQGFRVHALIGQTRAEGVPETVWRDLRQRLLVGLAVLLQNPPDHALIIGGRLRQPVLIKSWWSTWVSRFVKSSLVVKPQSSEIRSPVSNRMMISSQYLEYTGSF